MCGNESLGEGSAGNEGARLKGGLLAEELGVKGVREVGLDEHAVVNGQAHELADQAELALGLDAGGVDPVRAGLLVVHKYAVRLRQGRYPASKELHPIYYCPVCRTGCDVSC